MRRAIHPQSVAGQPTAVHWVTAVDLPAGLVRSAPGTVGPLLEYGVLEKVFVEPGGVWTWLAPGHTWTDHGPRIRDALSLALDLDGWEIEEGSAELLGLIATQVLEGDLKSYIASHGGHIVVAAVDDTTLTLDFEGACEDCPAAASTLHDRIESAVKARYPRLAAIHRSGGEGPGRGFLGLPRRRRR